MMKTQENEGDSTNKMKTQQRRWKLEEKMQKDLYNLD